MTCKNRPRYDLCVEWDVKPLHYYYYGWWSSVAVGVLVSINKVNLHRVLLVVRWATMSGFNFRCRTLISVCYQPATQGQLSLPSLLGL